MSRVWNALKEAERERAHVTQRKGIDSSDNPCEKPSERDSIDRREDTRPAHRVPLLLYGWDAEEQPFHEEAEAFEINENGSLLWLETRVARSQRLFLINMRNQAEQECRVSGLGSGFMARRESPSSSSVRLLNSGARRNPGISARESANSLRRV